MEYKKALIKELDGYLTEIAKYDFKGRKEYHHLIERANILYRYDFNNLYPIDRVSHTYITDKPGYKQEFIYDLPMSTKIWVEQHKNDSFKDYLLKNCLTEIEFLEQKKVELLARMPSIFDLYLRNRELNGLATFQEKRREQSEIERLKYLSQKESDKVQLRELQPKRRKLTLAREYKHNLYLKMKEYKHNLVVQRQQQELQTN